MPDIVRDMIRDVVDIKTEGTAGNGHDLPPSEKLFKNGDTKMGNSKHFALLERSNTGSRLRYPMNDDEITLMKLKPELLREILERFFHGFEVECFEQVGVKNNETDS